MWRTSVALRGQSMLLVVVMFPGDHLVRGLNRSLVAGLRSGLRSGLSADHVCNENEKCLNESEAY